MILIINCKDGSKQKLNLGEKFERHENNKLKSMIEMETVARITAMSIVNENYLNHKLLRDD